MPTASTLEIVTKASNLVAAIGDFPALFILKPIGSILVTICNHLAAVEDNKEMAIRLAERVSQAVQVLINRTRALDGTMPGNYLVDIKNFEDVLVKIATTLQDRSFRQQVISPGADAALLNSLSSDLNYAIQLFGLSADIEVRQAIQALVPKGAPELFYSSVDPRALRVHSELDATNNYSVQVGTYKEQAVVVKKYYTSQEERFAQDLQQRQMLIHPGIACIIGSSDKASIMLLCAEDLIFCLHNVIDINSVRRPWQDRRIGPQVSSGDRKSDSTSSIQYIPDQDTLSDVRLLPGRSINDKTRTHVETLTVKESDALLKQFISVVRFLGNMKVRVAWWEFKPSWVGLQGKNQLILIDWDQDTKSEGDGEFEPRYAIHVIGLGFSDIVPGAFQESGRLLEGDLKPSKKETLVARSLRALWKKAK